MRPTHHRPPRSVRRAMTRSESTPSAPRRWRASRDITSQAVPRLRGRHRRHRRVFAGPVHTAVPASSSQRPHRVVCDRVGVDRLDRRLGRNVVHVQRWTGASWQTVSSPSGAATRIVNVPCNVRSGYRVFARNASGLSRPSASVCAMKVRRAWCRSCSAHIDDDSSDVLVRVLFLRPPRSNGGTPVDQYQVQLYRSSNGGTSWTWYHNYTYTKRGYYDIYGIDPAFDYKSNVRAHNAVGWGPLCSTVCVRLKVACGDRRFQRTHKGSGR